MKPLIRLLLITGLFAIAMGFLESAVVVYLRELYYPEGFAFPLKMLSGTIAVTELFREAATMIMLLTVAWVSVKGWPERLAIFIYTFAVWDIFYYLFLYVILGWPGSLLTWDLLFLLPVMWIGPVLAPVINSLTMILLAVVILYSRSRSNLFRFTAGEWILTGIGILVTFWAYIDTYLIYMLQRFSFGQLLKFNSQGEILDYSAAFVPLHFHWALFISGEILFLLAIGNMIKRTRKV